MKYYYKIVRATSLGLISYNDFPCDKTNKKYMEKGVILKYNIGRWTYPVIEGSDLFIFDTKENAIKFCSHDTNKIIFKCEVKNPRKYGVSTGYGGLVYQKLESILKAKKNKKKFLHMSMNNMPEGTMYCSAIKLIEKV